MNGAHILDAGCGNGFYAEELVRRGARVTAVDGSAKMAQVAEERLRRSGLLGNSVTVHVADLAKRLDFLDDGSVQGILSPLVMHYMEDWRPALAEFRRVLVPGGWLLISTHHPMTEAKRFDVKNYFTVEHIEDYWQWVGTVEFYRRPLSSITEAITDAGFVIERLVEALPDETFKAEKPDAYDRILRDPDFLFIRARLEYKVR